MTHKRNKQDIIDSEEALQHEVNVLVSQVKSRGEKIAILERNLKRRDNKIDELHSQLRDLDKERERVDQLLCERENDVGKLKDESKTLCESVEHYQEENGKLQDKAIGLALRLSEAEKTILDLHGRYLKVIESLTTACVSGESL